MRGPAITPSLPGRPELPTRGERFDELVLETVRDIDTRWQDRLGLVEYAVEDTPQLPDDWALETVPLASLVRGKAGVVDLVAELLGVDPEDVDPRYHRDD